MKLWWVLGLNIIIAATVATRVIAAENTQLIKDPDGNSVGLLVICSSCESSGGSARRCQTGVQQGWLNGKQCGKCMLAANAGQTLHHAYDLHFTGTLVDNAGAPRKERFVRMFLANGWTVRTRTGNDGGFRLMLGATENRKSKNPVVVDLGTRVDAKPGTEDYSFYVLPESYKPCPPEAATPGAQKHHQPVGHKPKSKQP
jgi:hypothetical protein